MFNQLRAEGAVRQAASGGGATAMTAAQQPAPPGRFAPGDNVRWLASRLGWDLAPVSVIVEGGLDRAYLTLASDLYQQDRQRRLVGGAFAVIAAGGHGPGGTDVIKEHFLFLRKMIGLDLTPEGRPVFRAVVLLDSDMAGKKTVHYLTAEYTGCLLYRDVFLLHRHLPHGTREPRQLTRQIESANSEWKGLDCEIEDLLSRTVLEEFARQSPRSLNRSPQIQGDGHHFEWKRQDKPALYKYVEENAILGDLQPLVEVLRWLRFLCGLDPDGEPVE
jgi:hypothetical protein